MDLNGYGPKINKSYRYNLLGIHNFSKFGWSVPLKNENPQIIKYSFGNILKTWIGKTKSYESDEVKDFLNNIFTDFPKHKSIKR